MEELWPVLQLAVAEHLDSSSFHLTDESAAKVDEDAFQIII